MGKKEERSVKRKWRKGKRRSLYRERKRGERERVVQLRQLIKL
jgi:hypothetical protein